MYHLPRVLITEKQRYVMVNVRAWAIRPPFNVLLCHVIHLRQYTHCIVARRSGHYDIFSMAVFSYCSQWILSYPNSGYPNTSIIQVPKMAVLFEYFGINLL